MKRLLTLLTLLVAFILFLILTNPAYAEGSKNLTPSLGTGDGTVNNNFIGYLCHSQEAGITGNFLSPDASEDERLFVYIKQGETLYLGLRRIDPVTNDELTHQDLTIVIRENDGTLVTSFTLDDNDAVTDADGDSQGYPFTTPQTGVIESYAEVLAGPAAIVGASGYDALSWTNSALGDQNFYIEFIQFDGGSTTASDDIDVESWYDLWDFSVYDGTEEKPGRLHSKNWGFTAGGYDNQFSDDFNLYATMPSVIAGVNAGYYVKSLQFSGLQPYSTLIYANSTGAELSSTTDLNGDGTIDFQDARRTQPGNIGAQEYEIFLNNPDIELYPTTTLPEVTISNANFYCNSSGTGGEGIIYFESNQSGIISLILDLDGTPGYQAGTEDVIIEQLIDASSGSASSSVRWDGYDGNGIIVPANTDLNISGRFTAAPVHSPLYDPEVNSLGINMVDTRPNTSFDLVYWDDLSETGTGSNPTSELDGSNSNQHTWDDGNALLVNTWSFGYYQINTENVTFDFVCDIDGDGIDEQDDLDNDNDGVADSEEGNYYNDTDGDGIPDYLDSDFAGFVDSNGDGVNDNFDADLDGIPNGRDRDSDNDGIPDIIEYGLTDADNDGQVDGFTDANGNGIHDAYDVACDGSATTYYATAFTNNGGTNPANAVGNNLTTFAQVTSGNDIIYDMGVVIPSGSTVTITMNDGAAGINATAYVRQSSNGTTFSNQQLYSATTGVGSGTGPESFSYELTADSRYIQIEEESGTNRPVNIHRLTTAFALCSGGAALTPPDSDGDGIPNYLDIDSDNDGIVDGYEIGLTVNTSTGKVVFTDSNSDGLNDDQEIVAATLYDSDGDGIYDYLDIDSDNDGILDNVEGQSSESFIASLDGDTDGDGLLDVYDPDNGGSIITPVDTDTDGDGDYIDTDADGDGVADFIEGYDSNTDGICDLDTNEDGVLDNTDACAAYSGTGMLRTENADFENGLKSLSSFSGDIFVTADAQSGDAAIIAGPAEGGTTVTTLLPAEAGMNYQFTGFAKVAGGPSYAAIGITFWDADKSTRLSEPQQQVLATTYTLYTVTATAPANTEYIEVWTYKVGNVGTLTYDNFSLIITDACSGDITDDTNGDGLLDLYENYNSPLQNTDGADFKDWQDSNDDNDSSPTSGEDINNNGDWSDDFSEGGISIPDYLYAGDLDGDAIADALDADSDNDGIPDNIESNGESVDPSGDSDSDGIPNYKDAGVAASLSSSVDSNGDGIFDVFDSDLDGIPDFQDLDSDNDGIWDAVEAYSGSIPNGLNLATGRFNLNDPDNDGLMNYIDSSPAANGGTSTLANPDSDGDGFRDYVDIDSDGDGIVDLIESQLTSALISLSNNDADGDGIDDAFDPTNGGTLITPINTDGLDLQDYLDDDSDNDGVLDIVEGHDANNDGYGDWDDNLDGTTDEADYSTDSDGDGLPDAFDNVTLGNIGNSTGSNSALQDTDGLQDVDYRDTDDDADGVLTANEDRNSNGNFTDDRSNGQGGLNIPDYLFNGDYDNDGIPDNSDLDSDNDGVADADEDGGQSIDPSGDEDGDGIPNYRDSDDATVISGLTSTADTNGDGVYDVYDRDLDGVPDFKDADSDNDGIPDLVEVGGIDADGDGRIDGLTDSDGDGIPDNVDVDNTGGADSDDDGIDDAFDASVTLGPDADGDDIIDSADTDIDGDGLPNAYDVDNGGTTLTVSDFDGDGINDLLDLDSDNDGTPDIIEAGGTDADGDGKVDNFTDSDYDGLSDSVDSDSGGTAFTFPDSDNDGLLDMKDLDSDNDGITDAVENGALDTNLDGLIDDYASDSDNDGLADSVDPDSGGTAIVSRDTDGDGIYDYLDLDSDNDGYPDIIEAGGTDADYDGIVDDLLDIDQDGIPANVDVDQTGGTDADGDGIDDAYDVTYTGGNDNDGDDIDDIYDYDIDGNGFSDSVEALPYALLDSDNDGIKNFRDIDSDNDGIVDVIEFGLTADVNTGTISGFTDTDGDGFNDTQDGYIGTVVNGSVVPVSPLNSDSGSEPSSAVVLDYLDIDSDNDGIVDLKEAQSKGTFIALSGVDADKNGLDDAFDPNQSASLITPVNTDGDANPDYLDNDSDGDGILDLIEGNNSDKNLYGDWDANQNSTFDDSGYNTDTDEDGLLDIFDNVYSTGNSNVVGSNAPVQDTDKDGTWDFQDIDDDNDGTNTISESSSSTLDPNGIVPDYLYGDPDSDGDGVDDGSDLDQDNDGLANAQEDGGTGIDPSADSDGDGLYNFEDNDIDGDGIKNKADTNTGGVNTTSFTDVNSDGIIDQFDQDYDGVPDFRDRDSDNDGIADIIEFGLTDADEDGTLDEGGGITDANSNGLADVYDPACDGSTVNLYAVAFTNNGGTNPNNAIGNNLISFAQVANGNDIIFDMGEVIPSGATIVLTLNDGAAGINATAYVRQSANGSTFSNQQLYSATTGVGSGTGPESFSYVVTADSRYIQVEEESGTNRPVNIHRLNYSYIQCSGGVAITVPDTDSDGIDDYLDLDSDGDGVPDNIEAQSDATYTAPVLADADGDGILNVYDEDFAVGNAINPIDTDTDSTDDYLDTDSDDDGIADVIEAYDSDHDGYGDWDSDGDNDPTDEGGYSSDNDSDGISYLFDNITSVTSVANITGTTASLQDTDNDGIPDFRDTDDDEDGILTSAEDNNSNFDWTDDFTQGGSSIPNYLFNPDQDGDGVLDYADGDADNDGIATMDEIEFGVLALPFGGVDDGSLFDGDLDNDGIFNYLDSDMDGDGLANNVDTDDDGLGNNYTDANGDGVLDEYDFDKDGVPDFFDLDSDNDGIPDAVEANNGIVPSSNYDASLAMFTGADNDGDGILGVVDQNDANFNQAQSTTLANPDSDSDGIRDFRDLDSDGDGITDNREGQTTPGYIVITNTDTDTDGLKDVYDGNNGGSAITPTDTDSDGTPDYLDTDSDNDNVADVIEGFDANKNGFSDLDIDQDGDLSDETNYGVDQDGDGLEKLFDNYSGYGINNINGSKASLQDTDGDGILDWRDDDDDTDGINTIGEDANGDTFFYNDKTQGGGATPDYLYANDTDGDGIIDGIDLDADNDGITDAVEYNGATYAGSSGPFADDDADGILNYRDSDATNFVDTNSDGVDDRVDADNDGIPNFFDLDSDNDGIPDSIEGNAGSDPGLSGTDTDNDGLDDTVDSEDGGAALPVPDTDNDGISDYLDLDSDNDGLTDLFEAGGNDYNGDGKLDSFGDTDGDGLGNSVDADNGGSALPYTDTDTDGSPDYIDNNSDGDLTWDYEEAYYEAGPTDWINSCINRVTAYNTANAATGNELYTSNDLSPANGTPDYLDDSDGDGIRNLFDLDSPYFIDEDGDGLINLFDPDQNGNFFANVSGAPDRDSDGIANQLDASDIPLPLDFLSFEAKEINSNVALVWKTTNEDNVSHFQIEHSTSGKGFQVIGVKDAVNIKDAVNTYTFTHKGAIEGYNFYRLMEIDFDGYYEYSEIVYVIKNEAGIEWTVYPNPVSDVVLLRSNTNITEATVQMVDLNGRIVYQNQILLNDNEYSIDLTSLAAGVYQMIIDLPNYRESFRIIKQ